MVVRGKGEGEDSLKPNEMLHLIRALTVEKGAMETTVAQLTSALRRADATVEELEGRARNVQNAHERELGLMYDESMCVRSELEFKAAQLELENQRLTDEIGSYIVMQEQNVALKESLAALHDRARDAEIRHRTEQEVQKESIIEHKTKLHREFKMRLQEMSGQIAEEAIRDSNNLTSVKASAAKSAAAQSLSLQKRADESASHISVLMQKYQDLEKEYSKMKLEHGLAQQSMEIQTKEMLQLKRELLESRERCASLDQDLRDAKLERDLVFRAAKAKEKYELETATLRNEVQALREKNIQTTHMVELLKKRQSRGVTKGGAPAAGHGLPHVQSSGGSFGGHSHVRGERTLSHASHRAPSTATARHSVLENMDMKRVYPPDVEATLWGKHGGHADVEDVRKIWNSRHAHEQGSDSRSGSAEPPDGRAATAPLLNPRPVTSTGQFAQLHLPVGGGLLSTDNLRASSGRRSAPPRMSKSSQGARTKKFFNPQ